MATNKCCDCKEPCFIEVPDWDIRMKTIQGYYNLMSKADKEKFFERVKEQGVSITKIAMYFGQAVKHVGNPRKYVLRNEMQRIRWKILQRDNFICQYCGRTPPEVVLHVDHKLPIVRGGDNKESNLITACSDCNLGKMKDETK